MDEPCQIDVGCECLKCECEAASSTNTRLLLASMILEEYEISNKEELDEKIKHSEVTKDALKNQLKIIRDVEKTYTREFKNYCRTISNQYVKIFGKKGECCICYKDIKTLTFCYNSDKHTVCHTCITKLFKSSKYDMPQCPMCKDPPTIPILLVGGANFTVENL